MTHPTPPFLRRRGPLARVLATLCLALLPMAARASLSDVRLTEILLDPGGAPNGTQWVELMNAGAEPVDLSGAWIGADNSSRAAPLAGLAPVPPGGCVVVHWNVSGTSAGRDLYTGPLNRLQTSHGSLILSRSATLLDAPAMLAFAQWGAPDQKGADVADSLELWPREQFLPAIAPGHSHALAPGGSPHSMAGWFEAAAPTPGAVNTGPVSAWRGWQLVGAAAVAPAAAWDMETDLLDAIGVSAAGEPVHYRFQAGAWAAGIPLPGTTGLPVALAGSGSGNLHLAWTDADGGVWYRGFADGRWGPAVSLGHGAPLPPTLAYNPAAREMELVIADPTGQLQWSRAADGPWSAWSPVGVAAGPVPPALAINLLDRPFDLLFAAPDGVVKDTRFDSGAWSPPFSADGYTTLRPAAAVTGADTVEVVVTGPDHKVYYNHLTDGIWAGWRWTGLESATAPALLSNPIAYGLELIVTDQEGRLFHSRLLNGTWGMPWPLGGMTGQPAAVTAGPDGGLELLMAGADGSLWHNRFRPSSPDLVSLSAKVQTIFDSHCVQCHDSGAPTEDQDLEAGDAYSSIVQVSSIEVPSLRRVDPGRPDKSYLLYKVMGTQKSVGGKGDRMPVGGKLSDDEIRTLRDWIAQGALDN